MRAASCRCPRATACLLSTQGPAPFVVGGHVLACFSVHLACMSSGHIHGLPTWVAAWRPTLGPPWPPTLAALTCLHTHHVFCTPHHTWRPTCAATWHPTFGSLALLHRIYADVFYAVLLNRSCDCVVKLKRFTKLLCKPRKWLAQSLLASTYNVLTNIVQSENVLQPSQPTPS